MSGSNASTQPRNPPSDNNPLPREKLPSDLQRLVDDEDTLMDQIYDGNAGDSTDSSIRYAAYANRLRTIMLSAQRYVAYTSDVGESFRPIAHPWLVKSAYGISWLYLIGDVSHEGYKAYIRNQQVLHPGTPGILSTRSTDARDLLQTPDEKPIIGHVPAIQDYRSVMVQRAVFQSIASMGLPAFTIHSIVRYSGRALKDAKNPRIRTWGPIGLGLAAVPFLPYLFDKPVEEATEWVFHKALETLGGPNAVAHKPKSGLDGALASKKEKEL